MDRGGVVEGELAAAAVGEATHGLNQSSKHGRWNG
jgi:hypothetical protein